MSLLEKGLAEFRSRSWPGTDQKWECLRRQLARYVQEIELWNPRLGLVEATGEEILIKHIFDSLAPFAELINLLRAFPVDSPISMADIGSGAGLPGIPLLLALNHLVPDLAGRFSMTLVDKQQRRVGFLLNAKAVLGLSHLFPVQDRLENLAQAQTKFDLICCRAFSPLTPETLTALGAIARPGACLFLYKGRSARIDEELALVNLTRVNAVVTEVKVPFLDEERHLLLIRPGAATY